MQKDVALDPGIGAIEIQNVIGGSDEDIVIELNQSRGRTAAPREVHDVIVATGRAEVTMANDAVASGLHAPGSMHRLEGRRRGGKNAMADDK